MIIKTTTCPICGGNGKVMNGFYNQTLGLWSSSNTEFEKCRSCDGRGYIIDKSEMK